MNGSNGVGSGLSRLLLYINLSRRVSANATAYKALIFIYVSWKTVNHFVELPGPIILATAAPYINGSVNFLEFCGYVQFYYLSLHRWNNMAICLACTPLQGKMTLIIIAQ